MGNRISQMVLTAENLLIQSQSEDARNVETILYDCYIIFSHGASRRQ